jgi:Tfp pilus assembly protein PilF
MLPLLLVLPVAVVTIVIPDENPRDIVRVARFAVEGDSASSLAARWSARLQHDSSDDLAVLGLATLSRLAYDSASAGRSYRRLLAMTKSPRIAAYARLGWAELLAWRAPLDTAAAWLEAAAAAARAVPDSAAEAEALLELAFVRSRLGAAVLAVLDDSTTASEARAGIDLSRRAHDRRTEAFCYDMLGWYRSVHGADPSAVFDSALAIMESARDVSGLSLAHWWRGSAYLESYDHAGAQRELSAALNTAHLSGNRFIEGWACVRLAVLASHFADVRTTDERLRQAMALLSQQGDGWGVAYIRREQGTQALEAGRLDEAEAAKVGDAVAHSLLVRQPAFLGLSIRSSHRRRDEIPLEHVAAPCRLAAEFPFER